MNEQVQLTGAALAMEPTSPKRWTDHIGALIASQQWNQAQKLIALGVARGLATDVVHGLRARIESAQRELAVEHANIGLALISQQPAEAERHLREALALHPSNAFNFSNLACVVADMGRHAEAVALCERAVELQPSDARLHGNLGVELEATGNLAAAELSFRRALVLDSDSASAANNLACFLNRQDRCLEAEPLARQAVARAPTDARMHYDLGNALQGLGRLEEACACFRQALKLRPEFEPARGNLMFTLNYHADKDAAEIIREYRALNPQFLLPTPAVAVRSGRADLREVPGRRLRVGYVSPDLRHHSMASFLEPVLQRHDRAHFEVYAYAELARADEVTKRYMGYVEHWVETRGMSDDAMAARIKADGIDVLIDLAGHTSGNRLRVFARKPAPVSLTWLGYGYSTGMVEIDYLLTDAFCAPPGSEGSFAEKPWRLSVPAFVYRPDPEMGEVAALPALARGHVTFISLTRAIRINHRTIRVWSEILHRVPRSRLVLDSRSFRHPTMQQHMREQFVEHGIAADRLVLGLHSPPWDLMRNADIMLDCFPHNSGSTLFESLYMGLPYVTLQDRPSVGRLGTSILSGLGRTDWLAACSADSEAVYVERAVAMAVDLPGLSAMRQQLRPVMRGSALMDEAGFTRLLEDALLQMWRQSR